MKSSAKNKNDIHPVIDAAHTESVPHESDEITARLPAEVNMNIPAPIIPQASPLRLKSISIPSISRLFYTILRRTSVMPSNIYRRIDLAMLSQSHKTGKSFFRRDEIISRVPHAASGMQTNHLPTRIPSKPPENKAEEYLVHKPEAPPSPIRKNSFPGAGPQIGASNTGEHDTGPGTLNETAVVRSIAIAGAETTNHPPNRTGYPQNVLKSDTPPGVEQPLFIQNPFQDRLRSGTSGTTDNRILSLSPHSLADQISGRLRLFQDGHSAKPVTGNPNTQALDKDIGSLIAPVLKNRKGSDKRINPVSEFEPDTGLFLAKSNLNTKVSLLDEKPEKLANSKVQLSDNVVSKLDTSGINRAIPVNSDKFPITGIEKKYREKDLRHPEYRELESFNKTVTSSRTVTPDVVFNPVSTDLPPSTGINEAHTSRSETGQTVVPKSIPGNAPKTVPTNTGQPLKALYSDTIEENMFKAGSFRKIEPANQGKNGFDQLVNEVNTVQLVPKSEKIPTDPVKRAGDHLTRQISGKTGQILNPLSQTILGRNLLKSTSSHERIRLFRFKEFTEDKKTSNQQIMPVTVAQNITGSYENLQEKNTDAVLNKLETNAPDSQPGQKHPGIKNRNNINKGASSLHLAFKPYKASMHAPAIQNNITLPEMTNYPYSPAHEHTTFPTLNLQVVSSVHPQNDTRIASFNYNSPDLSSKAGDIMRSEFPNVQPSPLTPARRIASSLSQNQTNVHQQPVEQKNSQEAMPDIRVIAEKVFSMLKSELKIERERERHRILR